MATVNVFELDSKLKLLRIVDPTAVEDQIITNKTTGVLDLTFTKDTVKGKSHVITADDTVPLPTLMPGEQYTVTAQEINDAIAAGDHSDIYIIDRKTTVDSTGNGITVIVGGQTQPTKKSKAK